MEDVRVNIVKSYLKSLEAADVEALVSYFSESGVVHSPIYGLSSARDFYEVLDVDTISSKLTMNGIFSEADSDRIALYFNYEWKMKSGKNVSFDVVDIFTFDEDYKITDLRIIYDTKDTRSPS